jgi:O-antigen/teichoic acid export membrane protein
MSLNSAVKRLGPWAVFEYLINPALALLSTPLIIYYLGLTIFGTWIFLITTVSFAVALASGVSVSLGRYIAANSTDHPDLVRQAQIDALHVMAGASTVVAVFAFTFLYSSDTGPMGSGSFGLVLLLIVGVTVVVDCFDTVFAGILRGELRYAPSARAELLARIVQFGLMVSTLVLIPSILALALATCAGSLTRLFLRARLCDFSQISFEHLMGHRLSRDSPLLSTTGWASIQNLGNALYTSIDRIIISAAFGTTTLALYATASQLTNQIQAILGATFSVLTNATAKQEDASGQEALIRKCLQISVVVAFGAMATYGLFYAVAEPVFATWLGTDTSAQLMPLVPAVAIAAAVQTISVPAHFFLLGSGRFRFVAIVGLLAGVVSLFILWLATATFDPGYALMARASYGFCLFSYFIVLVRLLK